MSSFLTLISKPGGPDNLLSGCAPRTRSRQVIPTFIFLLLLVALSLAHAQDSETNLAPSRPVTPDNAASVFRNSTPPPAPPPAPPAPTVTSPQIVPTDIPAPAKQDDIDDIRPPFYFLHLTPIILAILAGIALIVLIILAWKWLSRSPYLNPKSAYDLTLEKLEKARALLREDDPVPYAVFVSETIRSYLSHRFQTPSTRRTTEEFLRMMEADPNTPLAAHSDLLRQFLQACDLVKFAKYQPTQAELEEVQQRAFSFVHATNPALDKIVTTGGKP